MRRRLTEASASSETDIQVVKHGMNGPECSRDVQYLYYLIDATNRRKTSSNLIGLITWI